MSIRSGNIRYQSLQLSEIVPTSVPANIKGAGPQNVYLNFYPCLAAHHVDKFGEIIPTDSKVIRRNTLNSA